MKKIAWVTHDCFADCDIVLMPRLQRYFDVHWIIVMPKESRFHEKDFEALRLQRGNLSIEFIYEKGRQRNPKNIIANYQLVRRIRCINPDAVYLNIGITLWNMTLLPFLKSGMTLVTAHQGRVHIGMGHRKMTTFLRKLWYGHFKNVNMFSRSQVELFKQDFPSSKIYQFVLGLKDLGPATNQRPVGGDVRFLSFGTLNYAKSIETLIDAACVLYERGVRGFKVSINGSCKDWSWYQQRIKYPEIFELDIRMIDNSEISNLFNGSHYLVQPYRVVSQSGPTKIAFNYNLPVIVSNLPGFLDELEEGVNGYSFECGNAESLANRIQHLIQYHSEEYPKLLQRMKAYTQEHYAEEALVEQYKDMLEEVMMRNETKYHRAFSLKGWLKHSRVVLFLRLIIQKVQELGLETRYLANGNLYGVGKKLKTDLQIRVHAIEKGMSIGKLKEGFGNKKACDIIDDLRGYIAIGGDRQFVVESCSVLRQYVKFKEEVGQNADDVKMKLNALMEEYHITPLEQGGVYHLKYENIRQMAKGSLAEVMASRYAVRDFSRKPIDMSQLRKALKMAEKSPSACNRQSWRIHVYTKDKALKIFNLQGGVKVLPQICRQPYLSVAT